MSFEEGCFIRFTSSILSCFLTELTCDCDNVGGRVVCRSPKACMTRAMNLGLNLARRQSVVIQAIKFTLDMCWELWNFTSNLNIVLESK